MTHMTHSLSEGAYAREWDLYWEMPHRVSCVMATRRILLTYQRANAA